MRLSRRFGLATAAILCLGILPASAAALPHVTSATFSGPEDSSTSPTITLVGTGFGTAPAGKPKSACPGFTGDVYNNRNLYFWDDTENWGRGSAVTASGSSSNPGRAGRSC